VVGRRLVKLEDIGQMLVLVSPDAKTAMIAETYLAQCFLAVPLQHGSRLERRRHESREGLWRIALRHLQVMSVGCV
jgi:hypothetical protein